MTLLKNEKAGLEKQIQDMCSNPWFGGTHMSAYDNTESQLKSKDNESKIVELRKLLGEKEKKITEMNEKIIDLESKVVKQVEDYTIIKTKYEENANTKAYYENKMEKM